MPTTIVHRTKARKATEKDREQLVQAIAKLLVEIARNDPACLKQTKGSEDGESE